MCDLLAAGIVIALKFDEKRVRPVHADTMLQAVETETN